MMKIRPIVIYPFRHPKNTQHLNALYLSLTEKCSRESNRYARPVTVVNRQTYYRYCEDKGFNSIYEEAKKVSFVIDAWCVDTCQMWLAGFGLTLDESEVSGGGEDISWLIPGDFDYATETGKHVLDKMYTIPETVLTPKADFCIGQLEMHPNSSKYLIDTYGTYGLLFNWFPVQAAEMRKKGIIHPRSEFFAIHHRFLRGALVDHRWFAYEQTIALLLQAGGRDLSTVTLGSITDSSEARDSLPGALQQIERTERVLKVAWRDQQIKNKVKDWVIKFRELEEKSKEIIGAAITVLENSL